MIEWRPWGADAFAEAARDRKPVLLSIAAAWCRACHEMDRTTYADAAVAAIVRDRFVAVRVDADRRPDINERYNLGGWPTTAFLTPRGDIMTGGTFVPVDRMAGVLERVAAAYAAHEEKGAAENLATEATEGTEKLATEGTEHTEKLATEGTEHTEKLATEGTEHTEKLATERTEHTEDVATEDTEDTEDVATEGTEYTEGSEGEDADPVIAAIFSSFDEVHGGFGLEPKFPHTAPLHLAMALFRESNDPRWRRIVERTLDAIADGGLWDRAGGGFYRYASTRDWQRPHQEKLLETNAALLRAFAEAAIVFGRAVDRDRCAATAAFITTALRDESGGYVGSDAERVIYTDTNAAAVGALLGAATVLEDSALAREALASFERVTLACYKPSQGIAHYFDGHARVRGLLGDQVAVIGALLDAHDVSDDEPYRMMAEELGHFIVREMWDPQAGGFFDRRSTPEDVGLLRRRLKPFVENATAAVSLARLSRLDRRKGFPNPAEFRVHAAGALDAAGRQLAGQGPLAAHYALARRQLIH